MTSKQQYPFTRLTGGHIRAVTPSSGEPTASPSLALLVKLPVYNSDLVTRDGLPLSDRCLKSMVRKNQALAERAMRLLDYPVRDCRVLADFVLK